MSAALVHRDVDFFQSPTATLHGHGFRLTIAVQDHFDDSATSYEEDPDMRLIPVIGSVCIAVGLTLGAGTTSASAEGCASTCAVGGAGTGGESSDGEAGGSHVQLPSTSFPGSTFSNSGNEIAGNISLKGTADGTGAGAITPQDDVVGHYDGVVAGFFGIDGTCNGVCG